MNNRKKVFLIVPRFPFPALSGGEKWVSSLVKFLSKDFDIYMFSFFTDYLEKYQTAVAMNMEKKYLKKIFLINRNNPKDGDRAMPHLPKMYNSGKAAQIIKKAVKEIKPDIAHIIFYEMAQYAAALPEDLPKVYTEIDSSYFFPWKSFLRETAGLKGFLEISQTIKTQNYAKKYYHLFDSVTAIAEKDIKNISKYFKNKHIHYTPNSLIVNDFTNQNTVKKNKHQILFIGHYPHFPNEDAALRLAKKIFPKVKKTIPSATLCLAGSFPTQKIKNLSRDDVFVPGTVDDIKKFLWRGKVFAAPTKYGLGTKGKVLEAFAAGIPVVASQNAAEGIAGAKHGENILIAKNSKEFAHHISHIMLNDDLAR